MPYAKELLRINNANVAVGNIKGGTSAGHEGFVYDVGTGAYVLISDSLPPCMNGRAPSELMDVTETAVAAAPGAITLEVLGNPVRDRPALRMALPAAGAARLSIYDVAGREVARVIDAPIGAALAQNGVSREELTWPYTGS